MIIITKKLVKVFPASLKPSQISIEAWFDAAAAGEGLELPKYKISTASTTPVSNYPVAIVKFSPVD